MSRAFHMCGMRLEVSCGGACLQINPGDVPWEPLGFHTTTSSSSGGGERVQV